MAHSKSYITSSTAGIRKEHGGSHELWAMGLDGLVANAPRARYTRSYLDGSTCAFPAHSEDHVGDLIYRLVSSID